MAKGQSKCKHCGRYFPSDMMKLIGGLKYCPDCAPARKLEAEANMAINKILYELCDNDASYLPRFRRELESLQTEYHYSSTTILKLFQYVFSLEEPPEFDPDMGVGWIVRHYYPQAKKYYDDLFEKRRLYPEDVMKEYLERPTKVIHIKRSTMVQHDIDFYESKKDLAYGPEIDLNTLFDNLTQEEEK